MADGRKTLARIAAAALLIGILFYIIPAGNLAAAATGKAVNSLGTDFSPLIWTVVIVGGCIVLTLSYVSWKKYKAETKEKRRKSG